MAADGTPRTEATAPIARHATGRARHPFVKVLSILGVVLAVLAVSAAGVAAFTVWDAFAGIRENSVEIEGEDADIAVEPLCETRAPVSPLQLATRIGVARSKSVMVISVCGET